MADQAAVNGGRVRINAPMTEGIIGNLAELGSDVATLAELQAKLAAHDLQESTARAALPALMLGAGLGLLLGAIPVILIGCAELLADALSLEYRGLAYLIVAAVAVILAAGAAWFALSGLRSSFTSFARSREELARNLAWIKTVLAYSGRSVSRPRR